MPSIITPEISVIMPAFNAASHLREAIESILLQTFRNFEFIIIDDGSTDYTAAIVKSYSDPRIRFIKNECNKGIVYSLNRGITESKSDLIARMDSDDISFPDRLEKQIGYLRKNPQYALVCSWINIISENGKFISTQKRYNKYLYYDLTFKCVIPHPTVMCTKKSLISAGMYRNVYAEDYDLWSRLITGYRFYMIEEPLLSYRISASSISNFKLKNENSDSTKTVVTKNIKNLAGIEIEDDSVLEFLMDNVEPLKNRREFFTALQAFKSLNKINLKILDRENPNKERNNIIEAIFRKKDYLIRELLPVFYLHQKVLLLILTNSWHWIGFFLYNKVRKLI
jgi:glycosyltransferase involved in cell wall biosynthesis